MEHLTCRFFHRLTRFSFSQATDWYISSGSPRFSISGMVHLRSNAFERTILKICDVVSLSLQEKLRGKEVYLLDIDAVTRAAEYETCSHSFGEAARLW